MASPGTSLPGPYKIEDLVLQPGGTARVLLDAAIRGRVSARFLGTTQEPPDFPSETFVWRLIRTAVKNGGVGLHAAQTGVFKDVFVMTLDGGETWHACVNPLWRRADPLLPMVTGPEGCLSVPGQTVQVPRHPVIRAIWWTPEGQAEVQVLWGPAAVVFQHETDHGRGKVIGDRTLRKGQ